MEYMAESFMPRKLEINTTLIRQQLNPIYMGITDMDENEIEPMDYFEAPDNEDQYEEDCEFKIRLQAQGLL